MDFHRPGLVGKIRTRRIHPGSSQLHRHIRATSTSPPNYSTVPLNGTTTQFHILVRLLAQIKQILTIQTALQSSDPCALFDVHHACAVPKRNPLARSSTKRSHEQKQSRSLWAVISVFILSPLNEFLSYRNELYIPGKMRSRPFQRCIDCRDAFMFDKVTKVCTLVYALRYMGRFFCELTRT